jgi:hypothetical protein
MDQRNFGSMRVVDRLFPDFTEGQLLNAVTRVFHRLGLEDMSLRPCYSCHQHQTGSTSASNAGVSAGSRHKTALDVLARFWLVEGIA